MRSRGCSKIAMAIADSVQTTAAGQRRGCIPGLWKPTWLTGKHGEDATLHKSLPPDSRSAFWGQDGGRRTVDGGPRRATHRAPIPSLTLPFTWSKAKLLLPTTATQLTFFRATSLRHGLHLSNPCHASPSGSEKKRTSKTPRWHIHLHPPPHSAPQHMARHRRNPSPWEEPCRMRGIYSSLVPPVSRRGGHTARASRRIDRLTDNDWKAPRPAPDCSV